jgi:hypothetical protein
MTDETLMNHLFGLFIGGYIGLAIVLFVITETWQVALKKACEFASVIGSLIPVSIKSWSIIFLSTIGLLTLIS